EEGNALATLDSALNRIEFQMKQVLIINITRMGDLVQMGTLLVRLREEWPGCAIDLVIDHRFAPVAAMLPGLRDVIVRDVHQLVYESRAGVKDVVSLYGEVSAWAKPLLERKYDRVVNLTFNRASALLAGYVGAPDIRGARSAWDGGTVIDNPWMSYFTDMHHFRRINRFNLVDLYAMGGSKAGDFAPLQVSVDRETADWARRYLCAAEQHPMPWIAVQAGASDVMKAWRPEYFGSTLAWLSNHWSGGIVFLGAESERETIKRVLEAYRSAGGRNPVKNAVGHTTIDQVTALLAECRLLLTNDTGPMHLAVAVRTPVVNISVGHVDFKETGPYGPGHWVLQPDLDCAPCGFDQVCPHHACKDRLSVEQVAELLLHVLGRRPFPSEITGFRVYESYVDQDQLGAFRLRAGHESAAVMWYGTFWRRYWYGLFTGMPSHIPAPIGTPPDLHEALALLEALAPEVEQACARAQRIVHAATTSPIDVPTLQKLQHVQSQERETLAKRGMSRLVSSPVTTAFLRTIQNDNMRGVGDLARHHAFAYRQWSAQLTQLIQAFGPYHQGAPKRPSVPSANRQACVG
ncbi:MAG: glycosyltransferase family 9 protein, partial [Nitrospira sp.]|nr:glycosyltransferase family 9 protein [Nitrospira sp.]